MMTEEEKASARKLIQAVQWKGSSSPEYQDCPHSYIVKHRCRAQWNALVAIVRQHGEPRKWRGHTFDYMELDGYVYWDMDPVLNRAPSSSLDNEGYPSKQAQPKKYTPEEEAMLAEIVDDL